MKLNVVLRAIRRERNLSQENLADELGIDYTTYNRYEKNASKIQVETLEKIAQFYKISLGELFSYGDTGTQKLSIHKDQDLGAYQSLVASLVTKFLSDGDLTTDARKKVCQLAFDMLEQSKGYFLDQWQEYYQPEKTTINAKRE